ncbi:hypothetical protein [Streptomyces sp. WAC06614]|uniref:hypothetical protein n=1 Tax=Streptomyces sp. WAC06614 TaxID=2487416 RepID=UPI000F78D693|nr:hypothetical protein [Streptomyces sp. WAC06614]RSS54760.1 hypothetical protein EF918_34650 [Streptomyces sp. WAC06614]
MVEKDEGEGRNDGDVFKVTEQFLLTFAKTEIQSFTDSVQQADVLKVVRLFSAGTADNVTANGFGQILGGGGTLTASAELQKRFQEMCTSLLAQVKAFDDTMRRTSLDLQQVHTLFSNAEDEATLTAKQMMDVLGDVLGPGATPPPPAPAPAPVPPKEDKA